MTHGGLRMTGRASSWPAGSHFLITSGFATGLAHRSSCFPATTRIRVGACCHHHLPALSIRRCRDRSQGSVDALQVSNVRDEVYHHWPARRVGGSVSARGIQEVDTRALIAVPPAPSATGRPLPARETPRSSAWRSQGPHRCKACRTESGLWPVARQDRAVLALDGAWRPR
jgi:hypothetical protein